MSCPYQRFRRNRVAVPQGTIRGIGERPNKQRTPDAAKAVIGQFPASVMTLALLAGYPDTRKRRSDAAKIVFLPS